MEHFGFNFLFLFVLLFASYLDLATRGGGGVGSIGKCIGLCFFFIIVAVALAERFLEGGFVSGPFL